MCVRERLHVCTCVSAHVSEKTVCLGVWECVCASLGVFTMQETHDSRASPSGFLAIPPTAAGLHGLAQASTKLGTLLSNLTLVNLMNCGLRIHSRVC